MKKNDNNETLLHLASQHKRFKILKFLLESAKATMNDQDFLNLLNTRNKCNWDTALDYSERRDLNCCPPKHCCVLLRSYGASSSLDCTYMDVSKVDRGELDVIQQNKYACSTYVRRLLISKPELLFKLLKMWGKPVTPKSFLGTFGKMVGIGSLKNVKKYRFDDGIVKIYKELNDEESAFTLEYRILKDAQYYPLHKQVLINEYEKFDFRYKLLNNLLAIKKQKTRKRKISRECSRMIYFKLQNTKD